MTIQKALLWGEKILKPKKIPTVQLDAEILLAFALNKNREWLIAHSNDKIAAKDFHKYQRLILRRSKFEPIAYIIGKKEFYGLEFRVNKNVLIPRPETEILVETILKEIENPHLKSLTQYSIADIGTGSGNIAITLAKQLAISNKQYAITASDVSKKALKVAKQNAKKHQVSDKIKFLQSDLFDNFPKNLKFDIICANLPYLGQEFKNLPFEPEIALKGGKTGIEIYKKFFKQIKPHLKKDSKIFIEIGDQQTKLIKQIIKKQLPSASWRTKIKILKDLADQNRVVVIYTQSILI